MHCGKRVGDVFRLGLTVEKMRANPVDRVTHAVSDPAHPSPLADFFREHAYEPGLFVDCAARCLAQAGVFAKSQDMAHVHRAAEAIRRNAMLQSPMVDDLLDVSLIAHGTMKLDLHLHDLSALVHSAVDTSAQAITAKSLALEFNDAHTPLIVEGDAGRLQQVFGNIISNAVKFSPDAGDIRIMIGREENTATVAVTDSGAGIAPEFLPFVVEMFRHRSVVTSASTRGSGSDWRW